MLWIAVYTTPRSRGIVSGIINYYRVRLRRKNNLAMTIPWLYITEVSHMKKNKKTIYTKYPVSRHERFCRIFTGRPFINFFFLNIIRVNVTHFPCKTTMWRLGRSNK